MKIKSKRCHDKQLMVAPATTFGRLAERTQLVDPYWRCLMCNPQVLGYSDNLLYLRNVSDDIVSSLARR